MSDGNGVTPPKQPPSLLGGTASSTTAPKPAGTEPRILAGLDGKGAKAIKSAPKVAPVGPRAARKGVWVGVVALLALVVAAGGIWRSQQRATNDDTLVETRSSPVAANGSGSAATPGAQTRQDMTAASDVGQTGTGSATVNAANTGVAVTQPPPTQAATIVDTPAPAANGETASTHAAMNNTHGAPQTDPVKALASRTDAADKRHDTVVSKDSKETASKHADKKMTRHEREAALREQHDQERAATRTRAKSEDPDADILAALFKHTNAINGAPGSTAAGAAKGTTADGAARGAKPAPGSLAAKVEACRSKGFFDGEVCRWQVCDGHWGSDPACPGNERAAAATH